MNKNKVKLFALESAKKLGKQISKELNLPLSDVHKTTFADGEILVSAKETVRNTDVFIVASLSTPANNNIMELLLFIDSLKRASAKTITVVISYYAYSRQDRKASGRQPIGAKLLADLLEKAGATKVIAIDLHNPSIQGFFDIPVDDLKGQYIIASTIKSQNERFTVVSPDHGGAVRARLLAELVSDSVKIAIVDKRRTGPNKSVISGILGKVSNKNVVIIDDMIDTGGTIIQAAKALKKAGAKKIIIAATHGIFSKGIKKLGQCKDINQIIITDSIESVHDLKADSKKLKIISLAPMIAKTIKATIDSSSISEIYSQIKDNLH